MDEINSQLYQIIMTNPSGIHCLNILTTYINKYITADNANLISDIIKVILNARTELGKFRYIQIFNGIFEIIDTFVDAGLIIRIINMSDSLDVISDWSHVNGEKYYRSGGNIKFTQNCQYAFLRLNINECKKIIRNLLHQYYLIADIDNYNQKINGTYHNSSIIYYYFDIRRYIADNLFIDHKSRLFYGNFNKDLQNLLLVLL